MTQELSTAYQPAEIEQRWYEAWEERELFAARPGSDRRPYTVSLPPPNVTGSLHMGHAFEHTLQDAFIRRARMQGYETLWLPGTDHAGISTQIVVERELAKEGTNRHELGREAFVARVWEWKQQSGGTILAQMRRLGDSCDWSRERFTMDEGLSRAVRTVFVRWFDDGLIYRGNRIINWCPRCSTALSDIEVKHEEVPGELVTFKYELDDGSGSISVATTRIETMLGDTGIAVHPDDERYSGLVGKRARHPFFEQRHLPIVADAAVDREFGTGAVKVTPAHDPLDFEIAERTDLERINILDEGAQINENGGQFAGLDRYEARQVVLKELRDLGLIEKVERPYVHAVGHCDRCGTEVEPWLSEQWFVRVKPLAEPAMEVVRDGRVKFVPGRFVKPYMDWMENIRDWCISRQLWWGHRIPVWYCDDCEEVFAALDDPDSCPKCSGTSIRQDQDVLDTWFSSQLWPFSTLGWPDQTDDLGFFYPTTLMAPGYEILFLWVARMIMSGLYFMGEVPFRDVLIHGIVRDFEGKKMSKSIGNVVDPLDMIARYGADALRFSLASTAVPGNDTNVSEDRIEGARNFANKLWNAARFVLLSISDERPQLPDSTELDVTDRWILSRLDAVTAELDAHLDAYNLAEAMRELREFTWSEFCDWYLELAKLNLSSERAEHTQGVLVYVLDRVLRLLHPVMPFITEELWSRLWSDSDSIMTAPWATTERHSDVAAEETVGRFQDVVVLVRRMRADNGLAPSQRVPVSVAAGGFADELHSMARGLTALSGAEPIDFVDALPQNADGLVRGVTKAGIEVGIALKDVVDVAAQSARLRKEIERRDEDIARARRKLENPQFLDKAPEEVITKEREKLAAAEEARAKLVSQLELLGEKH